MRCWHPSRPLSCDLAGYNLVFTCPTVVTASLASPFRERCKHIHKERGISEVGLICLAAFRLCLVESSSLCLASLSCQSFKYFTNRYCFELPTLPSRANRSYPLALSVSVTM